MTTYRWGLALCLLTQSALAAAPLVGNLTSVGSDTLGNLMALWGDRFNRQQPGVNVQVQAAGSSTAPVALAAGSAQLGAMSRPMQESERRLFVARYGYPPLAIPVAMDALTVVVNQDNPLTALTTDRLDALFSVTRRCGEGAAPRDWGELLPNPAWQQRSIVRYGRNSASGTWGYFKQQALCEGDFRRDVAEFPGSAAVVQAVARDVNGIGYASAGFGHSGVRLLAIGRPGEPPVPPGEEAIRSGRYPFSRPLWLYVNKAPGQPLPPLTAAFVSLVLSAQGQADVRRAGYLPLSATQRREARAAAGLAEE
ncbi:PstS family phosphate ABC transporter substrate-binding protein [Pantoea sp. 1.19]|uniref:PstS family phosphate ABC transporter substrate-binding protein n=1 Tax=Pantoea sp. 1.19 TaxID=1925589 RepID=UPI000949025C|nr:PstS family phosphate ABC transporter substrate-binding protein [Pantoea sp. 1.19]